MEPFISDIKYIFPFENRICSDVFKVESSSLLAGFLISFAERYLRYPFLLHSFCFTSIINWVKLYWNTLFMLLSNENTQTWNADCVCTWYIKPMVLNTYSYFTLTVQAQYVFSTLDECVLTSLYVKQTAAQWCQNWGCGVQTVIQIRAFPQLFLSLAN